MGVIFMDTFTLEMLLALGLIAAGFVILISLLRHAHQTNQSLSRYLSQQAQSLAHAQKERLEALESAPVTTNTLPTLNEEGEYDYINSQEGLPAKLDLARAYIEMEQYDEAKAMLNTVIEQGDEPLRNEAKALLKKHLS